MAAVRRVRVKRMPVRWLLCAALAVGCGAPESMEERIPVDPGGRLEVDLDLGDGLRPDPGRLSDLILVAVVAGFRPPTRPEFVRAGGQNLDAKAARFRTQAWPRCDSPGAQSPSASGNRRGMQSPGFAQLRGGAPFRALPK